MNDPLGRDVPAKKYVWDANGILIPSVNRFPSSANGAGFKPLADWVHAKGLKFGVHIVRVYMLSPIRALAQSSGVATWTW